MEFEFSALQITLVPRERVLFSGLLLKRRANHDCSELGQMILKLKSLASVDAYGAKPRVPLSPVSNSFSILP